MSTTNILNDMDIFRIMVYDQQIEESNIREIRQESKMTRSDNSRHQKPKKRFLNQESSMGKKDRARNLNSKGCGHTFERTRSTSCGKQYISR